MVLSFKHEKHQNLSNTAILDRTLKNARWEGADGEELISKTDFTFAVGALILPFFKNLSRTSRLRRWLPITHRRFASGSESISKSWPCKVFFLKLCRSQITQSISRPFRIKETYVLIYFLFDRSLASYMEISE